MQRTPYDKTVAQQITYHHPAWYARHGYIVVIQDPRGRFASDGEFDPFVNEGRDTADTIAWAAGLEGSDGRVATYGFSYPGAVQLQGAIEGPEALATMVPGFTGNDFFDGWTYIGGAFSLAFVVSWVQPLLALPDALKRGDMDAAVALAQRAGNFPGLYSTQPLAGLPAAAGRERRPVLLQLARARHARRGVLAADVDPRALRPHHRPGPARRRLVRLVHRGHARTTTRRSPSAPATIPPARSDS